MPIIPAPPLLTGNIVKALPWFSMVGEKLGDPAYKGWFLPFREGGNASYAKGYLGPGGPWPNVSACTPQQGCSDRYHDQWSTPQCSSSTRLPPNVRWGW